MLSDLPDEVPGLSYPFLIVALRELKDWDRVLESICLQNCNQCCSDLILALAVIEAPVSKCFGEVDLRAHVVGVIGPESSMAEPKVAYLATVDKGLVLLRHGVGSALELEDYLSTFEPLGLVRCEHSGILEVAKKLVHLELTGDVAFSQGDHEVGGSKPFDESAPGSISYCLLFHLQFLL